MSLLNTSLYILATARGAHENYVTWSTARVSKVTELNDGFYASYCTMPDGRIGKACVEARCAHHARSVIAENLAKSRLAYEYGVDTTQSDAQWIAFQSHDADLLV